MTDRYPYRAPQTTRLASASGQYHPYDSSWAQAAAGSP
jgi:hypothetical protein